MRRLRFAFLATPILSLALVLGTAARAPADGGKRVTLKDLIARTRVSPRVTSARASAAQAEAKEDETFWQLLPQINITGTGGPGPSVYCDPDPDHCIRTLGAPPTPPGTGTGTGVKDITPGSSALFYRIDASFTAPLFTFGKFTSGVAAAKAGSRVAEAQGDAAEADALMDAARAYYGIKYAREVQRMLEEGRDEVDKEIDRVEKGLAKGDPDVTQYDRYRLRNARADIEGRLSEVRRQELTALSGVQILFGDDTVDIDDGPLVPLEFTLGTREEAGRTARRDRPEKKAAHAGSDAAHDYADLEYARWWPDLVAVGTFVYARDPAADDPTNAFLNDPLNVKGYSVGLAVRWNIDFSRFEKVRGARAQERRAIDSERAVSDYMAFEAERSWVDVADARDRMKSAADQVKATHQWMVAILQNAESGLAEPREVTDVLTVYFAAKGKLLQATYDWNVGVLALSRATGHDWTDLIR